MSVNKAALAASGLVSISATFIFVHSSDSDFKFFLFCLTLGWSAFVVLLNQGERAIEQIEYEGLLARWRWQSGLAIEIEGFFQPLVRVLAQNKDIAFASRQLILKSRTQAVLMSAKVVFVGAAARQTKKSKREELEEEMTEDKERTPSQIYQGAIEEMMSNQTPVYRVLSLLSKDEFGSRSIEKQNQYIAWIRAQVAQLKRNRNYVIFDNPRAPKWGAAGAGIYTEYGFLQFSNESGEALFVRHERVARGVIHAIAKELTEALTANKKAYTSLSEVDYASDGLSASFGAYMPVGKLEEHLAGLELHTKMV